MARKKPKLLTEVEKATAVKYADRYGFPKAADKFGVTTTTIHRWKNRLKPNRRGTGKRATTGRIKELERENQRLRTNNQKLRDKIRAIRAIVKGRA